MQMPPESLSNVRWKAAAKNRETGSLQSAAEAGATAMGDGEVAGRGRGGGSGNRGDGGEEVAQRRRRRGRSCNHGQRGRR